MKNNIIIKSFFFLCALLIGTGSAWADDTYVKVTNSNQISSGSQIIIVCEGNNQAMTSSSNYPGTSVTITNSTITLTSSSTVCVLTVGGSAGAYTFTYGTNTQLSWARNGFSTNQTSNNKNLWTIASDGSFTCNVDDTVTDASTRKQVRHNLTTGNNATNKFGCYTTNTGKVVCLYVKQTNSSGPSISANNVNIAYTETSGSIMYSLDNATGNVTANVTSGDWLSLGTITSSAVPFTCSVNEGYLPRTAKVTLSFTGASNKVVTITQASNYGNSTNPYTVEQAKAAIDAAGKTTVSGKYVAGIVSQVDNINSNAITYWISDDGTTEDQFEVYKGKGISGANFSSVNDLQVGDVVVVSGDITYYSNTNSSVYEFATGSSLVSHKLVAPTFYPAAGAVGSGTELTISDAHTEANIYYTTDGSTPSSSSTQYNSSSKPTITAATTFKAIAMKSGCTDSDVASASYTLLTPVATPQITLAGGTYTSAQTTTITCGTEGATIYYTTNGDNPTTSSTAYTGAISINESMTIKVIAAKNGMANSAVAEATYTITIPVINAEAVNIAYNATSSSISSTITNPVEGGALTAAITGGNEGAWLTLGTVDGLNVPLNCLANEGNADRTATVTLTYTYDTNKTVTKAVTVTQAHFVVDYADLPFSWTSSFGSAPTGVTNNGVSTGGTGDSAYLKFDTDGDNIILKINERPGTLSFDIKGNPSGNEWAGTFTVETSDVNGTQWSSLASYSSVSTSSYDSKSIELGESVRYIKWTYSKTKGNLAMNNIGLTAYEAPSTDPSIVITTEGPVEVSAAAGSGELAISYEYFDVDAANDFAVQFYNANDEELNGVNVPSWITVSVVAATPSGYKVTYTVIANDGDERTAYFKVFADAGEDFVFSNKVTVTQAEYEAPAIPDGWVEADIADLTEDDVFVIVSINANDDYYALANDNSSGNPAAVELSGSIPNNVKWNISGNSSDGYIFYPNGSTTTCLYYTSGTGNKSVKVGSSNSDNTFTLDESGYLKNSYNNYLGVYSAQDWRVYSSTSINIGNQTFKFYKKATPDGVPSTFTVTAAQNTDGSFWATFYHPTAQYVLPEGAQAFTMNATHQLYRIGNNGRVIPEDTAVIIIAEMSSITLTQKNAGDGTIHDSEDTPVNILKGSPAGGVAKTSIEAPKKAYVLAKSGGVVDFYEFDGTTIKANRAYIEE